MTRPRLFALCIAVILLSATVTSAQDLSRYRDYQLGMSLAAVAKQAGLKPSDARVLHQRPDLIQELEWSQDVSGFPAERDTVRRILFSFHGGQLFRIAVSYNWDRTEGMTADDMIEAISGGMDWRRCLRPSSAVPIARPAPPATRLSPTGKMLWLRRFVAPVFRINVRHDPVLEAVGCHGARGRREGDPERRSDPGRGSRPNGPTRGSDTGDRAQADPGSRAPRQTGEGQAREQSVVSAVRGARPEA